MVDDTGDLLVRSGLVSSEALDEARRLVEALGGTLGEQLVSSDAISDDDLTEFYAQSLQVPRIRPSALAKISAAVIDVIPRDMAIALRAIPITRGRDNRLTVALSDPADDRTVEQISASTRRHVVRAVATQMQIAWCLAHYYDHMTPLGKRLVQADAVQKSRRRATTPAIGGKSRTKTASGEIRVGHREPPLNGSDSDADADTGDVGDSRAPRRMVEVQPSATDEDTAKIVARSGKRRDLPQPPELEARAGEVDLKAGPEPQVTSGPTIVVELGPDAGAIETGYASSASFKAHQSQLSEYADDEPTTPMWFERSSSDDATEPTKPGFRPQVAGESAAADKRAAPARIHRTTHVGVPEGPGNENSATKKSEQSSGGHRHRPAGESSQKAAGDHSDAARSTEIDFDTTDPGWGQPGATIPPPLRGDSASFEERDSDAIPLPSLDAPPLILATTSMTERSRPHSRSDSQRSRALEDTTERVLTLIHYLETATERDSVVTAMVHHLAETHRRAGMFVVRNNELSLFSIEPRPSALSAATLRLDRPSTLLDVIESRLPYRGPVHDPDSREYLQAVLGACPPEILVVPIAVRDRVVGLLFGEHRLRHTFDDQLALAARAAGMALERILMAKRA